jgi:hypothetical protein
MRRFAANRAFPSGAAMDSIACFALFLNAVEDWTSGNATKG